MLRSRMFWRLFGFFGAFLLVAIGGLGLFINHRVEQQELRQIEDSLRNKALLIEELVRGKDLEEIPHLQERVVALRRQIATRITLIDRQGKVLADSDEDPTRMDNHGNRPEVVDARIHGVGTATRRSDTLSQRMLYLARRLPEDESVVAYVRVALPLTSVEEQLSDLRRVVWTAAGVTLLAAMLLAFWLARRITLPLRDLTAGAERIAAGAYGFKVQAGGADELGTLVRSFNAMSERLEEQFSQLEEDRQQLRAVLSGMVEGVVAIDAEQRILFANKRAGELLEFQTPFTVSRKLWEVVRQRTIQQVVQRALADSEPHREELDWQGQESRSLVVYVARLPGSPTRGAVLVLHDNSELRRLERLRHEFVANVSHELKTPLSVITACVETLLDGAIDDHEHRGIFLEQIADQAHRLHMLILDLLSLARIEAGTETFDLQAVPLGDVVRACLERHHTRSEAKRQSLLAVAPPGPEGPDGVAAWAEEEAISQILDNLVDNAVKYTPEGGRIRVRWWAEDGQVGLEVEDSGIGIPERDLPRIFERFYRVDKARSRELGGTGLGLAIVKHLVQAMHGTIRASSQLGQGTTFSIRLPRAPGT